MWKKKKVIWMYFCKWCNLVLDTCRCCALAWVQLVDLFLSAVLFSRGCDSKGNSHNDLAFVFRPNALADATTDPWATVAYMCGAGGCHQGTQGRRCGPLLKNHKWGKGGKVLHLPSPNFIWELATLPLASLCTTTPP